MPADEIASNIASAPAHAAFVRRVVSGVVLINLLVFGLVALSLYQSHAEFEERAEVMSENLAQMLAQDVAREIEKIDVMLQGAADEIERQLAQGGINAKSLNAYLGRLQDRVPEVISMRATDAAGIVCWGRGVDPKARLNNSDREYFTRQRNNPAAGLVVSKPVFARIDKKWVIPISRAYYRPDGAFGGVAYSNVALDHFAQVFSSLDVGGQGSVSLRDADLRIYARHPVPRDPDKVYGFKLEAPELAEFVRSGREAGTYVSSHTVDGARRKFAVHRVASYPFYAVIGKGTDEYLTPWRAQAAKMIALTALFSLATILFAWQIYSGWKRQLTATIGLAREEEKFHTVADYTFDWEYWEGPGGEILFMSPSCERVTGYTRAEFMADPGLIMRIVHPEDLLRVKSHRHDASHEDVAALDFRIVRKDGEERWIAHGCRHVYGRDGRVMGRRISNRDITERKQAEAALSRLNAELETRVSQRTAELEAVLFDLENLTYSASHDLRIPLRAIDGFARILAEEYSPRLDDEGKRLLKVVRDNAGRMAQYIDDMLAFTRLGRKVMKLEQIDMGGLVNEVVQELAPAVAGRDLKLEVGCLPLLVADRSMMRQAVFNLLSNAIKFSRHQATAVIQIGANTEGGDTIFYVKDNGVGFDMRYVDKLFGVFQRLHSVTEFEGTGIGLAIVKRIVTRHGGRVWAEGKINQGATVYFALPTKEATHG